MFGFGSGIKKTPRSYFLCAPDEGSHPLRGTPAEGTGQVVRGSESEGLLIQRQRPPTRTLPEAP